MQLTDRQFNWTALSAVVAIAPHLSRLPWWLSLGLILIAPLRIFSRWRGAKPISGWWRAPLVVLLLVSIIGHYGNVFGREPGCALAAGLLVLKLLETERIRDARAALGFSAFVLMSALLFTNTLSFTVILCLSLILLLAALNSLEPAPIPRTKRLPTEISAAAVLFASGLPLAIAAFLLIPRLSTPLWGAPGLDQIERTGLSETMSPGSLTELLIDDTPALRARFDSEPPPPAYRYFRAIVMWDFDGVTWTRGDFWRNEADVVTALGPTIGYEITLEPTDRPWLIALDVPVTAPENARISSDRTLFTRARVIQPRQYRVTSALHYVLAPDLDDMSRKRALRLPAGFNPKTRELAAQWRAAGRGDAAIVESALAMFSTSFTYTLTPPPLARDSVDDFLFSTQAGFCEHFSSAFVFLMRSAGIPARVVTGYQGGWWNESSNYLLVRNSDAHAWSEVWLEGKGWTRVDPTAAVSPMRIERGADAVNDRDGARSSWWREARNRFDVVNRLWTQTIVQFNALRQKSLLTPFGIDQADQGDLLMSLAIISGIVLLLATLWVFRGSRDVRGDGVDASWRRLRRYVAGRGVESDDKEGPLDYLQRIKQHFPASQVTQLERLVLDYVQLRYAGDTLTAEQIAQFARRVRQLRLPRVAPKSH
jgi:transglutaminase-like putative cysteine protease